MKKGKLFPYTALSVSLLLAVCGCAGQGGDPWDLGDADLFVGIHTTAQADYLADKADSILKYANGHEELSRPRPLRLTWDYSEGGAESYTVEYSTDENFNGALSVAADENYCEIYNLCIGTTYYWRVTAHTADGGTSVSPASMFLTEDVAPRNLYVDGITNVRDLGGWATADGGRVKQGMIFRCGRLNKSGVETPEIEITEKGIAVMRNELKIKSEIDLRMKEAHDFEAGGITSSPLGADVHYYNVELEWNKGNYLTDNVESVKEFFRLAADESNYPFIFHCNIGTDRTGMFAFFINGLLGVSEDDLYRDYLFSDFGKIDNTRTLDDINGNYLKTVKACEGATLSEKIENCLIGYGVPREHLEAVKAIMK